MILSLRIVNAWLGANFHQTTNSRLNPAERWEALFADTPELNAAWERAAHPKFYDANAWIGSDDNQQEQ